MESLGAPSTTARFAPASKAFALVVVLAFITLLTFLVVAFMSRSLQGTYMTASSSSQAKAEQLCRASIVLIVAGLKEELVAGADPDLGPAGSPTLYLPKTNHTFVPSFSYSSDGALPPPNVLKRSALGVPFFSSTTAADFNTSLYPSANWASKASTTTKSLNGRSISNQRWNTPLLINDADITGFLAPDWVIVTRGGPKAFPAWNSALGDSSSTNPDFAVGRFAYVIYNEGGLLDINVAGNRLPTAAKGKPGRLHSADLSQIPSFIDSDAFLTWRTAYSGNNASMAPKKGGLFDPYRDFSKAQNNASLSDQIFLNRQELITYAKQHSTQFNSDLQSLQYLGTFSRSKNAPSSVPSSTSATNPNLLTLRFTRSGTLPDGTAVTVGMPFFRKRFPLSRLAWITPHGPSASLPTNDPSYNSEGTAANIKQAFGLKQGADGYSWDYTGSDGSSALSNIKTLAQVADIPREPDFFEVLKAVILEGSLGQNYNDTGTLSQDRDKNRDVHIMQIGANLIDQSDPDDFPTLINFVNPDIPSASPDYPDKRLNNIRGVENLPYLNEIAFLAYRPVGGINAGDSGRKKIGGWFIPRLWNPHQNATSADSSIILRFVATEGSVDFRCWYGNNSPVGPGVNYDSSAAAGYNTITDLDPAIHRVTFRNSPVFAEPGKIRSAQVIAAQTQTDAVVKETSPSFSYPRAGDRLANTVAPGIEYDFAGILLDPILAPDKRLDASQTHDFGHTAYEFQALQSFELQFSPDGGTTFFPYFRTEIRSGSSGSKRDNGESTIKSTAWALSGWNQSGIAITHTGYSWRSLDPRSRRLGFTNFPDSTPDLGAWWSSSPLAPATLTNVTATTNPQYESYIMPKGALYTPVGYTGGTPTGTPFNRGYYSVNSNGLSTYYKDPDEVLRRADGDQTHDVHPTYALSESKSVPGLNRIEDRPLILNRPFRSVGEMGYAFRDTPWKTLNLFSGDSADAAVLDALNVDEQPVTAGSVDLNTRQPIVLQTLLAGTPKNELNAASAVDTGYAQTVANWITSFTADPAKSPLKNRSELASLILGDASFPTANNGDYIKTRREATVRALGEAGQTRTWNLLIDVIAQSGRYPGGISSLDKFQVEGERRYWLHLALDRLTGEVVDEQWEPVYE